MWSTLLNIMDELKELILHLLMIAVFSFAISYLPIEWLKWIGSISTGVIAWCILYKWWENL